MVMVRLGGYPDISGQLARKQAKELLDDLSKGQNRIITKHERKRQKRFCRIKELKSKLFG